MASANADHMIQILITLTSILSVCSLDNFGQTPSEKYTKAREKSSANDDIEKSIVTADEINVSADRPLLIKSPDKGEIFKVYVFTKLFETKHFKVFIGLSDDPFKPNLVTTNKTQTQIDKLQLLGNYGQSRPDFEVIEEVKIVSDKQILLSVKLTTWTLKSNGQRIESSKKVELKSDKYKITENGKFQKIVE